MGELLAIYCVMAALSFKLAALEFAAERKLSGWLSGALGVVQVLAVIKILTRLL